jgi:hypothetical protein
MKGPRTDQILERATNDMDVLVNDAIMPNNFSKRFFTEIDTGAGKEQIDEG